jgi:hypothetical protein
MVFYPISRSKFTAITFSAALMAVSSGVLAQSYEIRAKIPGLIKPASEVKAEAFSHTFTNCGQVGRIGPTLAQCQSAYAGSNVLETEYGFDVSNGIQTWVVPADGTYRIEAFGASGAHQTLGSGYGGKGAAIKGDFKLHAGDIVHVAVGQQGRGGPEVSIKYPAGGGGSFVYVDGPPNDPLIVAGGGAGVRSNLSADAHGQAGMLAGYASASANKSGLPGQHVGVGHGSWIDGSNYQCSGGGAGWLSQGADGSRSGTFGVVKSDTSSCGGRGLYGRDVRSSEPLVGGFGSCATGNDSAHVGGFGGGGGGGCSGEGGGGGYTGGAGTYADNNHGGGAGSFNAGANQENITGANRGHGKVLIKMVSN